MVSTWHSVEGIITLFAYSTSFNYCFLYTIHIFRYFNVFAYEFAEILIHAINTQWGIAPSMMWQWHPNFPYHTQVCYVRFLDLKQNGRHLQCTIIIRFILCLNLSKLSENSQDIFCHICTWLWNGQKLVLTSTSSMRSVFFTFQKEKRRWLGSRFLDMKVGSNESTGWKLIKSNLTWWCSTPQLLCPRVSAWKEGSCSQDVGHKPKGAIHIAPNLILRVGPLVITYHSFKANSQDFYRHHYSMHFSCWR